MKNRARKIFNYGFVAMLSFYSYASEVKVIVKTQKAAAIGYTVEGKSFGGLGKSYSGTGPKDKEYKFGYRNRIPFGTNIPCGSLTLTGDSTVILIQDGDKCYSILG